MALGLLIIPVILVVFLVVARRPSRTLPRTPGRASPRRRKIVRIVLVGVGAFLLLVVSHATWRDIHAPYASPAGSAATIHLPTQSVEQIALARPEWSGDNTPAVGARLIIQVVLIDTSGPAPVVLNVDEYDTIWDPNDTELVVKEMNRRECKGTYTITVTDLSIWNGPSNQLIDPLQGGVTLEWRLRGGGGAGYTSGPVSTPMMVSIRWASRPGRSALSLLAGLERRAHLELTAYVRLAGKDDPLKAVPVTELEEISALDKSGEALDLSREALDLGSLPHGLLLEADVPPAFRLLGRMGISSLLLLGAALGLARLAKRYSVGVMIAVPAAVLLVVLADRSAVSVHEAHLMDRDATMETRYSAASRLAETFFFRRTASEAMTQVADDPAQPEPLRNITRLLSRGLDAADQPLSHSVSRSNHGTFTIDNEGRRLSGFKTIYNDDDYVSSWTHPMLLLVEVDKSLWSSNYDKAYIALSQVDCYRRIVTLDDQLTARIIGTEADFIAAVDAFGLSESDVWKNVILPALMPAAAGEPDDQQER